MKACKVGTYHDLGDGHAFVPGRYMVSETGFLLIILPCGHAFRPNQKTGPQWEMHDVEDPDKITLSPSIFCSPSVPCWHGYLTAGEFKP